MPPVAGNIIVIAILALFIGLALRQIINDFRSGGCSGGCASCRGSCTGRVDKSVISASEASGILKGIKKPEKLRKAGGSDGDHTVKTVLKIDGMMCSMCEAHINEAVRRVAGVKKVRSSHRRGETVIISDEAVDEEALRKAVEAAGYEIRSFSTVTE